MEHFSGDYEMKHTPQFSYSLPAHRFSALDPGTGQGGWWLTEHELPSSVQVQSICTIDVLCPDHSIHSRDPPFLPTDSDWYLAAVASQIEIRQRDHR
jgi:hypothetical protein